MLQHFELGNAVEVHSGIMFDFYPGLLHISAIDSYTLNLRSNLKGKTHFKVDEAQYSSQHKLVNTEVHATNINSC